MYITLLTHIFLINSMLISPPIPEMQHFQILTLKIQGQGQMTMMLHKYSSRQFHRTLNGINPSSGFRDMGSAKSGPSAAWFNQVISPWANPYGANGPMTWDRQVHETLNGLNPSSGFRDMRSAKSGHNFQYQLRVSQDVSLVQIWWFQLKSVTSYRADKVKFTDRQTDGQCRQRQYPWGKNQ